MRVVEYDIDLSSGDVVTLNDRRHHQVHARKVKPLRLLGYVTARQTWPVPNLASADLTVRIGWPNRIRRDAHNAMPTFKALIDGMVDAGLLPDDDDRHLTGPDLRPYYAGVKGVVRLRFIFTERAPHS